MKKGILKQRVLALFLLIGAVVSAQKYQVNSDYHSKINVSGSYYWGTIFKHNSLFLPDVTQKSHAFELAISKQTNGEKPWQRRWNYPQLGAAFFMARFGDNEVFGNAYAVIPYVKFWLKRSKPVDLYFRAGMGLGYITRPFDYVENPDNNVIGSKINNCTQFSLGADFKINRELSLFSALNFTHFSNASFQAPNLGINYIAFSGGFRYLPNANLGGMNEEALPKPVQKNFFRLSSSIAFYEYRAPGGPKYPIFIFSGAYVRATSVANRIFGGIQFTHDLGRKEFLTQYVHEYKKMKANDLSVFVGDEIFFGRLSFDLAIGAYLLKAHDNKTPIYARLGLNYHALKFGQSKEKSMFIGIHMKTHYFVAQYFDVGLGVNL